MGDNGRPLCWEWFAQSHPSFKGGDSPAPVGHGLLLAPGDPYKRCSETGRGTQPQVFLGEGAHSQGQDRNL